jgi:predicted PurR-regulated permease PerM
MDLLFEVLIAAAATAYVTELATTLTERFISPRIVKSILTLPLAFLACWLLGSVGYPLIVCGIAAGFFSVSALHLLNRPVTINNVPQRRY